MAMIKTCKVPTEERTVSGSSVSFNSAFALPLKACKVSFEGTQEGSGTTSPTNKRPLTYKSNVSISDNGSTNIISLGGRRFYKFDLDVLNGILEPTMEIVTIDENSDIRIPYDVYIKSDACDFFVNFEQIYPRGTIGSHGASYALCDTLSHSSAQIWSNVGYPNRYGVNQVQFHCNIANDLLGITDYTQETITTALAKIKAWLADNPITCAIPIEETIQLSPEQLSSILGNNTFSTDTGTLEITFADLQEKSASGSVATFNTALAMPLVNGEFTIEAYQEGSGDPSPDNVRNIVGFSEINISANGENLFDNTFTPSPLPHDYTVKYKAVNVGEGVFSLYSDVAKADSDTVAVLFLLAGNVSDGANTNINGVWNGQPRIVKSVNGYVTIGYRKVRDVTPEEKDNRLIKCITKQLGRDVYGGTYNSVTGKLTINRKIIKANDVKWIWSGTSVYHPTPDTDVSITSEYPTGKRPVMCNIFVYKPTQVASENLTVTWGGYTNNKNLTIKYNGVITSLADWNECINNNDVYFVYYIPPFDIQLTPTQIETIRGNNTIFADTGDVDLTYKDLDIAKRGNFREVFKLP